MSATRAATLALRMLIAGLLFLLAPLPAHAAVTLEFFSRELGGDAFPHAFVRMTGTLDDGTQVNQALGFTAKAVTPAILMGSVPGEVINERPGMIARSNRQFSLTVDDARYRAVMAVVDTWRTRRQPSYNLNRRNCVHFVGELAAAAGLRVTNPDNLMKRPRSYLQHIRTSNPQLGPQPQS